MDSKTVSVETNNKMDSKTVAVETNNTSETVETNTESVETKTEQINKELTMLTEFLNILDNPVVIEPPAHDVEDTAKLHKAILERRMSSEMIVNILNKIYDAGDYEFKTINDNKKNKEISEIKERIEMLKSSK